MQKSYRYSIDGLLLYMSEATFEEYGKIRSIMGEKMQAFVKDDTTYAQMINEMHTSGALAQIFAVSMKVDRRTFYRRVKNEILLRHFNRRKFDPADPIKTLRGEEVAQILTDFFVCNASWTTSLLPSQENWDSAMSEKTGRNRQQFMKWSTHLQARTSPRRTQFVG